MSYYDNCLYLLKKSGLYRLNISDGSLSELLSKNDYTYFSNENVIAEYFVIKDEKEFYVIGYSGGETASEFYQYKIR